MKEKWTELYEQASKEVWQWREIHKKATLTAIEQNVDEQLAQLRARMIEDLALASELADMRGLQKDKRPQCPQCEAKLQANGKQKRTLLTDYEQAVELERSQAVCPQCGGSFFPSG